ncbi:hypothetical protein MIMGU_mgv1a022164mg, partial [Erythranthe guttata]
VFDQAMSSYSIIVMTKRLEIYDGFEGIKSVVDVGGGTGAILNMIISKYPSIKAINFDLPHVIQHAPSYPGNYLKKPECQRKRKQNPTSILVSYWI